MSGGKISVLTKFSRFNPFTSASSSANPSLSSSVADSPEASEDISEGIVTVPGVEKNFPIEDIPIVTDSDAGAGIKDMIQVKPVTSAADSVPSFLTSTCSSPESGSNPGCDTREFDHMYSAASQSEPGELMAEVVHLREMLVSQLDLIQQQSETILSKEKQLKQLREENSLLMSRLSRMERRCRGGEPELEDRRQSGVNQTGGKKRDRDSFPASENIAKKKKVEDISLLEQNTSVGQESLDTYGLSCDDELTDEFMSDMLSVGSRPDTPASIVSADLNKPDANNKPSKKKKLSLDAKRKSLGTKSNSDTTSGDKHSKMKKHKAPTLIEKPKPPQPVHHPVHETKSHYFVGCLNDLLPNVDDHLEVSSLQRGVEVPSFREDKDHYKLVVPSKLCIKKNKEASWRIKSTSPVYSSEDASVEDVVDQTFLKRHEKFEKEEKQRKRWDLQRLREEQQLQKLRARQEKQILIGPGNASKKDETSLLPFIESATHVSVEDKIPVSAFGRPLPSLPHNSFSLPWVKSRSSLG